MNRNRTVNLGTAALALLCLVRLLTADPSFGQSFATGSVELDEHNLQAWRIHILPEENELKWQQIPWLMTFQDGIVAADAADRPLLLWTMNGHPFGCT